MREQGYLTKINALNWKMIKEVRLEAQKEIVDDVMQIYTKLKDFEHYTEVKKAYEKDIQNHITKLFLEFERKYLNTPSQTKRC